MHSLDHELDFVVSRATRWSRLWYRINTGCLLRSLLPIQELLEKDVRHLSIHNHRSVAAQQSVDSHTWNLSS